MNIIFSQQITAIHVSLSYHYVFDDVEAYAFLSKSQGLGSILLHNWGLKNDSPHFSPAPMVETEQMLCPAIPRCFMAHWSLQFLDPLLDSYPYKLSALRLRIFFRKKKKQLQEWPQLALRGFRWWSVGHGVSAQGTLMAQASWQWVQRWHIKDCQQLLKTPERQPSGMADTQYV